MERKKYLSIALLLFTLCFWWFGTGIKVYAAVELDSDEDGNITWKTEPTKATSGIRWRTQGFLVYAKKTTYGYPLKSGEPYGKILVDDERVSVKTDVDQFGKYISTFTIDADYTKSIITSNKKLYSQFKENIKDGKRYIYFNNFFQSYRLDNGRETILTSNMYDIDSIRNNQYWANKNEWDTGYFNIKVPYNVTSNVHVKLADANGNYLGEATGATNDWGFKLHNVMVGSTVKKNPYLAFYNKKYDAQGICDSKKKIYAGDEVTVALPETIVAGGKTYTLYRSYYYQTTDDTTKVDDTRITSDKAGTIKKRLEAGLDCPMVVGRYKLKEEPPPDPPEPPGPPDPDKGETLEGEFTDADPYGVVQAGTLEQSDFDVLQGIPGTETLYAHVMAPKYLAGYVFTKKTGTKVYTARGSVTWNLSWIAGEGEDAQLMTATQTVTYSAPVTRTYSYWEITSLDVYGLSNSTVENGAFPAGSVTMAAKNYTAPSVTYLHSSNEGDHVKQPDEISQILNLGTMSFMGPSPPAYDAATQLNAMVGECRVKNDRLVFDGKMVMDDAWNMKATARPGSIETEPGDIVDKTLYETGLVIPGGRANGTYGSSGSVTYGRVAAVGSSRPAVQVIPIEEINQVIVHTPVVCEARVEDLKKYCQMLYPDKSRAPLILGMPFRLSLPASGTHRSIPGYGIRDYGSYTAERQVRFPFEVCRGTLRIPAGTWIPVAEDSEFFLPVWVREGKYELEFRTISINTYANLGLERTEGGANLDVGNYVAVDQIPVEVSGRMYGLAVTGIRDAGIWKSAFCLENGLSSRLSYGTGCQDQNGVPNGRTLNRVFPLVEGDHPQYQNVGPLKRGYTAEFELTTIGDYEMEPVGVALQPEFYIVGKDGKKQTEVDIYYTEVFRADGREHELVKAGSTMDAWNVKWREGYPVYSAGKILLPSGLRTEQANGRIQTWKGEYCLPVQLHVCKKGFPLEKWIAEHGAVDYQEPFWIREGYVMVNLDIVSLQKEKPYLSYRNEEQEKDGYCNMWRLEGGVKKKQNTSGIVFDFGCGDFLLYDLEHSLWEDAEGSVLY